MSCKRPSTHVLTGERTLFIMELSHHALSTFDHLVIHVSLLLKARFDGLHSASAVIRMAQFFTGRRIKGFYTKVDHDHQTQLDLFVTPGDEYLYYSEGYLAMIMG